MADNSPIPDVLAANDEPRGKDVISFQDSKKRKAWTWFDTWKVQDHPNRCHDSPNHNHYTTDVLHKMALNVERRRHGRHVKMLESRKQAGEHTLLSTRPFDSSIWDAMSWFYQEELEKKTDEKSYTASSQNT